MRTFVEQLCKRIAAIFVVAAACCGCMKWESGLEEEFQSSASGVFIVCEGMFQFGNASLSYYDPAAKRVENEVFYRANAMRLGDVAQSATMHNGLCWVAVNNSHVIFAIDPTTFREVGRIVGVTSPRYVHFVSDEKAYVTQIWDNRILIVNPRTYAITGHIECPNMEAESGSTEQMVQVGDYLYVVCWSYQNRLLKIDTRTDRVVDELTVGIQPNSIVCDAKGRLWVLTDGGYRGSVYGEEAPSLLCINIDNGRFEVERRFQLRMGSRASELQIDGSGRRIYWLADDVWSMSVDDVQLPVRPHIESRSTIYYGLSVSPLNGDIYIADAIDHQQSGMIYRYSSDGILLDKFYVGVTPGAFCWR